MKKHLWVILIIFFIIFSTARFLFSEESFVLTEEQIKVLDYKGFEISSILKNRGSAIDIDMKPEIKILMESNEKWLKLILNVDSIFGEDIKINLAPLKGNNDFPDYFIAEFDSKEGDKIDIALGESTVTITVQSPLAEVIPDVESAKKAFHKLVSQILKIDKMLYERDVEVENTANIWFVNQSLVNEDGSKKIIPWTWSESLRFAISRSGKMAFLQLERLPEQIIGGPPAGKRIRVNGSWFEEVIEK